MRICAILEFQKPRTSFASFTGKFVYRGIAAGPVPPVSLPAFAISRTLCPSQGSPRKARSRGSRCRRSVSRSRAQEGDGVETARRLGRRRRVGRRAEVTRKRRWKRENMRWSTLGKKAVDSHRRPDDAIKARTTLLSLCHLPPFWSLLQASHPYKYSDSRALDAAPSSGCNRGRFRTRDRHIENFAPFVRSIASCRSHG